MCLWTAILETVGEKDNLKAPRPHKQMSASVDQVALLCSILSLHPFQYGFMAPLRVV